MTFRPDGTFRADANALPGNIQLDFPEYDETTLTTVFSSSLERR